MAASRAWVTQRKKRNVTRRRAQSTASGSRGADGRSAPSLAAAALRQGRGSARDHTSEEKSAKASQSRKRNVEPPSARLTESSLPGLPGENVAKNAVVAIKRGRASAMVLSTEEMIVTASAPKFKLVTPTTAPSTESGASGATGPNVPRLAPVASPRRRASVRVPSTVAVIAKVTTESQRSAISLRALSMANGSHGERGENAAPAVMVARRSAPENVKDLNMEERTAQETNSNSLSLAIPLLARLTESGPSGERGASALMVNSSQPALALDHNSAARIALAIAKRSKPVRSF